MNTEGLDIGRVRVACLKAGIENVTLYRWRAFRDLRNRLTPEDGVVGEWVSQWQQNYSPAPDIMKESTFDDCIRMELSLITDSIHVYMDDGDNLDGRRVKPRCSWSISPSLSNRDHLHELFMEAAASRLMTAAYEKRQQQIALEEAEKINNIFKGFFK